MTRHALALISFFEYDQYGYWPMPLYEYECNRGHRFEAVQKVGEKPVGRCSVCSSAAHRVISRPTLLHNRGIYVFDRETKDDVLRNRPSSLKSFKKDKF